MKIKRELERFLLELGVGFAFVARQKRITVDGDDFQIKYFSKTSPFADKRVKLLVKQSETRSQMTKNDLESACGRLRSLSTANRLNVF